MNTVKSSTDAVCAVVVTYNIGDVFRQNFESFIGQVDHVIIVDNSTLNETKVMIEQIRTLHPDFVHVVYNSDNSLARAQNVGIRIALGMDYKWVLLLDHDSHLEDNMISHMLDSYHAHPNQETIGIVAPYVHDENVNSIPLYLKKGIGNTFYREGFTPNKPVIDSVLCVCASGSLIPAHIFDRVGFMNESYFMHFVDTEFCLRLVKHGYRIVAVRDAVLYHQFGKRTANNLCGLTVTTTNHPPLSRYYINRNRLKTWKKYITTMPSFVVFDFLRMGYEVARIALFEEQKKAKFSAMLAGVLDGIRGVNGSKPI